MQHKVQSSMRFAVAGLLHETNTYATEFSGSTPLSAFEQFRGTAIDHAFRSSNHQIGGFIEGANQTGTTIVFTFLAQATPSGTIDASAYRHLKQTLLDEIHRKLPVDGVLLAMHGAAIADGVQDVEGDLASAVRRLVGRSVPIVAVYDLHGNVTDKMIAACDLTLPCRLYPHTDFRDRGRQAVNLMIQILNGDLHPIVCARRLPMLPYIVTTEEGFAPFDVNRLCDVLAVKDNVIDCSWFHGFPYADINEPCPTAICTTNGNRLLAQSCADEIAMWIWKHRQHFRPHLISPEEGVAQALAAPVGPIVINEYSDNPGGGAPGDGTHLLRAILQANPAPGSCCFAIMNDSTCVNMAKQAGVAAKLYVSLGGRLGPFQGGPVEVEAYVKSLTDGRFVNRAGSTLEGVQFDLGNMCRLVIGGVDVVVASRAEQTFDIEPFLLHGIDVTKRKLIAIKGANHFRAGFASLAADILPVNGPGLSSANIETFPRRHLVGKFWPLTEDCTFTLDRGPRI